MSIDNRVNQNHSFLSDWKVMDKLGSGSGGKSAVYRLSREQGDWTEYCALKIVNLIEEDGDFESLSQQYKDEYQKSIANAKSIALQEVRLMEKLRGNTNIVNYLDCHFEQWQNESGYGCDLWIRMELLSVLRNELRHGRRFTEKEIVKLGKDICNALILCHDKGIIHRDIKPENIKTLYIAKPSRRITGSWVFYTEMLFATLNSAAWHGALPLHDGQHFEDPSMKCHPEHNRSYHYKHRTAHRYCQHSSLR